MEEIKGEIKETLSEKKINKRKGKIINWLKNPYNSSLLAIILLAIAIRIYYFVLTSNQPLWWDEAEYMQMARKWAFGINFQINPVRDVLLSFITAIFFKISQSEILPRLMILLISIVSVPAIYLLGKEVYDKKIGLLAAFFMSVFYLNLFYTYRLMVDLPSLTFFTFSAFLFFKYFKTNKPKYLYLASLVLGIGTLFRITTALLLLAVLIYLLFTEKLKFLLKKEIWISALIFLIILAPYLIWGYLQFHGFILLQAAAWNAPQGTSASIISGGLNVLGYYITSFPIYLTWILLIFFILGLLLLTRMILGFDILMKEKEMKLRGDFFIILLLIIPLIINSFAVQTNDDRYIFCSFPSIFIISGLSIMFCFNYIKKKMKIIAVILIILLLGFVAFSQIESADTLIKQKLPSYVEVMEAGLFLRQNSNVSDEIITSSPYQIGYYSHRDTLNFPASQNDFESLLKTDKNIKFYVISAYEQSSNWTFSYPQEENLTIAMAYFFDQAQTQPAVIIYNLK